MDYNKAVKLRNKYLPIVVGKIIDISVNLPITDIIIIECSKDVYDLSVEYKPKNTLDDEIYRKSLKKYLEEINFIFNPDDLN